MNREIQALIRAFEGNDSVQYVEEFRLSGKLKRLLPELYECVGQHGGPFHKHDVYNHQLAALGYADRNNYAPLLKFAVLIHDIGKAKVFKKDGSGRIVFHKHESVGKTLTYKLCKRLKFNKQDTHYLVTLVGNHMFRFSKNTKDRTIKRWLYRVGKENWRDLIKLRIADRRGNPYNDKKPAITAELKDLQARTQRVIDKYPAVFREDIEISINWVRYYAMKKRITLDKAYKTLIDVVNKDPLCNNKKDLGEFVRRKRRCN